MPFAENISIINTNLRKYQIEAKEKIYNSWNTGNRSVMLQMPTGTGKTRLFASIIRECINWGIEQDIENKVLVVTHRLELIEQAKNTLQFHYDLHAGVIKAGYPQDPNKPVQIASIQTHANQRGLESVNLVIIDEAHHALANTYQALWERYPKARFLGVTATPYRLDGSGFSDLFDELVTTPYFDYFIKYRYLSNIKYYAVPDVLLPDLSEVNITAGDYSDSDLMNRFGNNSGIQANLVKSYKDYVNGKKGIVYSINQEHSAIIKQAYNAEGIDAEIVDSATTADNRTRIIQNFKDGLIKVLINVDVFSEGFNCPDIDFIQLARPSKSLAKYLQQIGRCMRPAHGKTHGFILDNVGMYKENGLFNKHWDWDSYFYGGEVLDFVENPENGISQELANEADTSEGDEEMMLLTNDIEIDINIESDLTLKDFFPLDLQELFKILLNRGYSDELVYDAIKVLNKDIYVEVEGIYERYSELVSNWQQCNTKIINCEQEIAEYENAVHQKQHNVANINYLEFLETHYPILFDLFSVYLKHKGNEDDALKELVHSHSDQVQDADNQFNEEAQELENNQAELEKIAALKHELSNLRDIEKEFREEIEDLVNDYRDGKLIGDINSQQKTESLPSTPYLPVAESMPENDAIGIIKDETQNLRRHLISSGYRYLSGNLFVEYERLEKLINEEQFLTENDRQSLRKILLKQKNNAGYIYKHSNIISVLNKIWKPTANNEPTEQVYETKHNSKIIETNQDTPILVINLEQEIANLKSDLNFTESKDKEIQNFNNGDHSNKSIMRVLKTICLVINKGYRIAHLHESATYLLKNPLNISDPAFIPLLVELVLLKSREALFHFKVSKEIKNHYTYPHRQIQLSIFNHINIKSHGGGFYSHISVGLPENIGFSEIRPDVSRRISQKYTEQEYQHNKQQVIDEVIALFPNHSRIQIEFVIEKTLNLI